MSAKSLGDLRASRLSDVGPSVVVEGLVRAHRDEQAARKPQQLRHGQFALDTVECAEAHASDQRMRMRIGRSSFARGNTEGICLLIGDDHVTGFRIEFVYRDTLSIIGKTLRAEARQTVRELHVAEGLIDRDSLDLLLPAPCAKSSREETAQRARAVVHQTILVQISFARRAKIRATNDGEKCAAYLARGTTGVPCFASGSGMACGAAARKEAEKKQS